MTKKDKWGQEQIGINHWSVVRNFLRGAKTFGESHHLRELIRNLFTREEFADARIGGVVLVGGPRAAGVSCGAVSMPFRSFNDSLQASPIVGPRPDVATIFPT